MRRRLAPVRHLVNIRLGWRENTALCRIEIRQVTLCDIGADFHLSPALGHKGERESVIRHGNHNKKTCAGMPAVDVNVLQGNREGSKNHREHRVPVTDKLRPRLENLYRQAKQMGARPKDQLFNINRFSRLKKKTVIGGNMDHPPMRAFFRRLSRECQCDISPHRFRHTIATDLMKTPERSLNDVKMLLGHSSVAVTLE